MNPLVGLHDLGQSFWWDTLSRRGLRDGSVERMRDENGMRGITSNPAIFQKAVSAGDDYDEAIAALRVQGLDREAIFWKLAVEDIQEACDVLRPVFDGSDGADGFVSLEVDPRLAHDSQKTLSEARRLWGEVDRPNLMIKIPGTPEGIPAIRQALTEGIHVNVTLLFSPQAHVDVLYAHADALEARLAAGQPLDVVQSVASFFVSRVDAAVDRALGEQDELKGRAAVANAKVAYANFEEFVASPRWKKLAAAGAKVQRPLWASTSTKNPSYPDTLYVRELIGPDTVNTMPTATVEAWLDHGVPVRDAVRTDVAGARSHLETLEGLGISMQEVTAELLSAGVRQFEEAYRALLDDVQEKMASLHREP